MHGLHGRRQYHRKLRHQIDAERAELIGTQKTMRERVTADLAEECLYRAGRLRLRVMGASMLPAIRPGSCVEIRRVLPGSVRPGDVVLIRIPYGFRLHRLVEIRAGWVITRGDNHPHNDPPEPLESLLGVAAP